MITDVIIGAFIGFFFSLLLIFYSDIQIERRRVMSECEESIPRNQYCEYSVIAKVVENKD